MINLCRAVLLMILRTLIQYVSAQKYMANGIVFNDINHNLKPDAEECVIYNSLELYP
jgi:hypothetical protein